MESEMVLSARICSNGGFRKVIEVFKHDDDVAALFGVLVTGTR